jgi:RNA polymerase primary sigma factor
VRDEATSEDIKAADTAIDALVRANMRLVHSLAHERQARLDNAYGLEYDDLASIGFQTLVECAYRFLPSRQTKFSTYAYSQVGRAMDKLIFAQSVSIRPSFRDRAKVSKALTYRERIERTEGRVPSIAEMAAHTGNTEEQLKMRLSAMPGPTEGLNAIEAQPTDENVEAKAVEQDTAAVLREALTGLDEKTRMVIAYRFGFADYRPMSLRQVGDTLGMKLSEVTRREQDGLNALRDVLPSSLSTLTR